MPSQNRINSIDLLRGIIMVIMALDHTRDYFHAPALLDDPLNLQTTTPALFATRWITHLCAPTFIFLSGTSAYLQSLRKSKKELSLFLLTRGIWLILVELLIMTPGITFDIGYHMIVLQVIWAIGICMVILSAAIWLPFPLMLALGLILVLGHNVLDYYEGTARNFSIPYSLLHVQSLHPFGNKTLLIIYPILPWIGVMILGYCFGKYYLADIMNRNKRSILLGAGLILFFIILRWTNTYGDPLEWKTQRNGLYTFFSFIDTRKYPPSLLYVCMTIGPSLMILGLIGNVKSRFADIITVFGRVPLFYYVIHFYLLHILTAILYLMRGHSFYDGLKGADGVPFKFTQPGEGFGLAGVYIVWLIVVVMLYPLCRWFADLKRQQQKWWLSYL